MRKIDTWFGEWEEIEKIVELILRTYLGSVFKLLFGF